MKRQRFLFCMPVILALILATCGFQSGVAAPAEVPAARPTQPLYSLPTITFSIGISGPAYPSTQDTLRFGGVIFVSHPYGEYRFTPQSAVWNFGDGTTANGGVVTHQYSADGDYTVFCDSGYGWLGGNLTNSIAVSIRTHDVAVEQMRVPKSTHSGKSRPVAVTVTSLRYAEQVQVQLFKRVAGGDWQPLGSQVQTVGLDQKKPVQFTIDYIASPQDASAGEVTLRAVAVIVGLPDAFPNNNEMLSEAVTVKK